MSVRGFAVEGIEHVGEDQVIDFEVTANRPDCMCVLGIAREVATAYGLPILDQQGGARRDESGPTEILITIENPDLCPRYAGAVADVTVGPSPDWMQARLRAAGLRPISNIVDITNYVLLERGQPMHAFDLARLRGAQIRVRTARAGEKLRTLDGQLRELSPDMLVIAGCQRRCRGCRRDGRGRFGGRRFDDRDCFSRVRISIRCRCGAQAENSD
jgi:phenylalanyl-tRNA synthetase beta chain